MKNVYVFLLGLLLTVSQVVSAITPNTVLSRGKTINTSSGNAAYLTDNSFTGTAFTVSANSWLALNVGNGKTSVYLSWNNPNYTWSDVVAAAGSCKQTPAMPVNYTIQTSANSTNGNDGTWTTKTTVTNNTVTARGHVVDITGASWIKMSISSGGGQISELEVFDLSAGGNDRWFFPGTSITANTYKSTPPAKNYADLIHQAYPAFDPVMIRGGIPCINSTQFKNDLSLYLASAGNVNYWAIEMGTNDAWGGTNGGVTTFKNNMQAVITACKNAGIQPVLARMISTNAAAAGWQVHADYLTAIDALTAQNNLIAGPDFYTYFLSHTTELNSDGVHPNAAGAASIQKMWADKMGPLYATVNPVPAAFAKGADVGWLSEMESVGRKFYNSNGVQQDLLQILKDKGINSIRLRVWVNPANGWCGKTDVVNQAKRAQAMGFRIMIDFHYSDSWADPGQQTKPAAWATHTITQLIADVNTHTLDVLNALKTAGVTPEWVQVGNETNNGMLWEEGRASASMKNFADLVTSGYNAVKAVFPNAKVVVHISNGYDNTLFRWMFDGLKNNGAKWDVIGMSLYPTAANWQTLTAQCLTNMQDMVTRYGKEVVLSEIGMTVSQPQACKDFITDIIAKNKSLPNNKGIGVFYWEPESYNGWNGYDLGAFDAGGKPTIAMDAFLDPSVCTATITAGGVTTFCTGGSVTLTASAGSSYKWFNGTTQVGTASTYSATTSGSYTVEVTNASTCKATSTAVAVTVNTAPPPPTVAAQIAYCRNSTASALTASGASLKWYTLATGGNASSAAPLPSTATAGTTNYYVSQTVSGCESMRASVAVVINALPVITSYAQIDGGTWNTVSVATLCAGSNLILGPQPAVSNGWSWTGPNGFSASVREVTLNAVTTAQAGTYTASYTDANTCKASASFMLSVNAATTWYADADGDGKGDAAMTQTACSKPAGYVAVAGDACPADASKVSAGNCGCGKTENSCLDCAGVPNGTAAPDACQVCAGGTTGVTPVTNTGNCTTTDMVDLNANDAVKISPNPSSDRFQLVLTKNSDVQILTSEGKLVEVFHSITNLSFGEDYAKGVYVVQISNGNTVKVLRVIKQ